MPRVFLRAREPFSSYSHFVGAVLSGIGLFAMLLRLMLDDTVSGQLAVAAVVFCLSLIALYSASSIYHFSGRGEAVLRRLKKLDHSMIYVLIAGSYTPIVLRYMPAPRSYLFLGAIWLIALSGIAIKLLWIDAPRLLGTALYLALGWAIALDFGVVLSMPAPAIFLLAAGGLSYTVGGIVYITKKPNIGAVLGFHELFHLFVIAGSLCHYLMVFWYVL
ncbi:PAQR family membrane homeostasis protein TrhA [Agathobaculum sp.]|uniref:PAQR family membrane homeostasis protein TrhA n=1 Tax=Agathobaculum sp. TaxID=2048138 RepID=UPI001C3982C1|nr:hemolysin III family protein [Agathobaculum sp.]MBS6640698.1 hemolysin III family protein [Clostridiaceae bacterium]HIX10605.1 hemolysin III family protein [Candidatus Agathobaculum pullistercoris]